MYQTDIGHARFRVQVFREMGTEVEVRGKERSKIEAVFEVFEKHLAEARLPDPPEARRDVVVFIAHGRSTTWRSLKDHLQD
jgi:hypothetical protein